MLNKTNKVMLIDDNEIDLKINAKLISLSKLFDETIICQSAEEALDYLNKYASETERLPNFILLDIQMPDMDGFDFLEQYKNLSKNIADKCTIAMLSSTLDFGDIQRAEANPYVVKLLKKPLSLPELTKLV
ncbi:MAG: response regulator [Pedobacter sp.]|nr:MAG: response regulator [Pedobacter sp.]